MLYGTLSRYGTGYSLFSCVICLSLLMQETPGGICYLGASETVWD